MNQMMARAEGRITWNVSGPGWDHMPMNPRNKE
jgi:hypothetical protein